ncbi:MAG: protein kinase [Gemmatimonadota bacterium]|nr:MAG: protein kinase [Gemmatimonadota bacterium]
MDDASFLHLESLLREDTEGEFDVERPIGRGGMAVVYLATEVHLHRKVAIKVLPPELTFGHGVERFKREARTAAALDHPNIIPIYRVASGGKIFWYAMKYLEGQSLDEYLKDKERLSVQETISILDQVAEALDYAHEHGVVHRDMKPANVMLDSRGRVTVTDFGIAKAFSEGTLTASGSVVGTPYYMSPEQGMGRPVSGASDQYSVGVMAYRMLSGQVPFEGDSSIEILHKHCMVAPPPLDSVMPGLPRHVYWTVHRALEKKPERRLASVRAFVEALRKATPESEISEVATVVVPTEPSMAPSPPPPGFDPSLATTPIPAHPATPAPRRPAPATVEAARGRRLSPVLLGAALGLVILGGSAAGIYLVTRNGSDGALTQAPIEQSGATEPPAGGTQPSQSEGPAAVPDTSAAVAAAPDTTPTAAPTPVQTPPPPTTGRVTVSGLPRGGSITVDGRTRSGTTFELSGGSHEIRMAARGYEPVTLTVDVTAGERMTVPYTGRRVPPPQPVQQQPARQPQPQRGVLDVMIRPWANVFVDGTARGSNTRLVDTLAAGEHTLRFERDGFTTVDTTVTLQPGQTMQVRIRMRQGS